MASRKSSVQRRQQQYVDRIVADGFDFGLTVADAFVRSIRSLGYRHCGTAIDELIDNSIEAGARNVHVCFGFGDGSEAKPVALAVLDDGWGMVPDMVRASVVWGGTDRDDSHSGFGRFGYGLPSASVSQGKRFTVFSRVELGSFRGLTLDVDEIAEGKYVSRTKVVVPKPKVMKLPPWVVAYAEGHFPGGSDAVRTAVVWEKLDRITWRTASALQRNLLQHLGVTYRNYLRKTAVSVNGLTVEPIDPLFVTPGARFYDMDDDVAEAIEPLEIELRGDERKPAGTLTLRMSYMGPTFFRKDKAKKATGRNANPRFAVRKDHNGVIVCRLGRQMDVVSKCPYTTFVNYDRSIGIEIDFGASLDSEFGVTTSKQQITVSDRVWELLREHGFLQTLEGLRRRFREESADLDAAFEFDAASPRPSEIVMQEMEDEARVRPVSEDREQEAEANLDREAKKLAKQTGLPVDQIKDAKRKETSERPFRVERERKPGGSFYRAERRGEQLVVIVNTAHRFFSDVYASFDGREGARLRSSIELLLFVLGECEWDSDGAGRYWYGAEREEWSKRLHTALQHLDIQIEASPEQAETEMLALAVE